jgi:hypothetical protein
MFTVDSTSKLDLTDNDLVDHDGNFTAVNNLLRSGFNAGAGYWNGHGINSSKAAAGNIWTLGEGQPLAAGTFDNETVGTSDVEIRFTYYGDADLDGVVDGGDYSKIDYGYVHHLTGFDNGDFNYDGTVNGTDYTLIDNAYNTQSGSLAAQIATPTSEISPAEREVAKPAAIVSSGAGLVISLGALAKVASVDLPSRAVIPRVYNQTRIHDIGSNHAAEPRLLTISKRAKHKASPGFSNVKIVPDHLE